MLAATSSLARAVKKPFELLHTRQMRGKRLDEVAISPQPAAVTLLRIPRKVLSLHHLGLCSILAVLMYVLSYGPALSLEARGYLSSKTVDRVYTFHGLAPPDKFGLFWMQFDPVLRDRFRKAVD